MAVNFFSLHFFEGGWQKTLLIVSLLGKVTVGEQIALVEKCQEEALSALYELEKEQFLSMLKNDELYR